MISPDYFRVLKHQLKRGRGFVETDSGNSTAVVIVNEAFANQYLAGADPLNERLIVGRIVGDPQVRQIIGIVGDVKQFELGAPAPPTVFVPISQISEKMMLVTTKAVPIRFAIRTIGEPLELAPVIKREMLSLDSSLPVTNLRSMDNILSRSIAPMKLNMTLLVAFAVVGLTLTIIGIYGVISYSVMQRNHEIGIRMALGAQMGDVLRLVLRRGMIAVLIGIGLGLIATLIMTRILRSTLVGMLYETSITDFVTFAGVSLLLATIGLIACYFPARRATKANTLLALRHD
jgi:putative ABC transport system permease protein